MSAVDLRSDTQTRPTADMRAAMAAAEVGDEQRFEDPTVTELQRRVAELLGHEAALLLPSGTMCNLIAFRLHLRPGGDEVILAANSHPAGYEAGGPAAVNGAMTRQIETDTGIFTAAAVEWALRRDGDRYAPRSRLVSVEQSTNLGGGRVWTEGALEGVLQVARAQGLRAHLDGARLLNAASAADRSPADMAGPFDTAWLDFSKGLGAPVGAVLAGSRELIEEAWRYKQMFGGAMRQAGVLAAACLYALDHHVQRLADDHANARALADGLAAIDGITLEPKAVETNIVIATVGDSHGWCEQLAQRGVLVGPVDGRRIRAVTHLDVDADAIQSAIGAFREVASA